MYIFYWLLVRVTLVVTFGFLPQNFGGWLGPTNLSFVILQMQVQCWGYHEVVGQLKPYHMLKNLFEFIALKDNGDGKTLGTNCVPLLVLMLALLPTSHLVKLSLTNI